MLDLVGRKRRNGNIPAARTPQAHRSPAGLVFSVAAFSQVQSPAARATILLVSIVSIYVGVGVGVGRGRQTA